MFRICVLLRFFSLEYPLAVTTLRECMIDEYMYITSDEIMFTLSIGASALLVSHALAAVNSRATNDISRMHLAVCRLHELYGNE